MAYQTSSAPTPCTRCGRDCGSHWTIVAGLNVCDWCMREENRYCRHGQLARSCNICDLEAERDALKAENERLRAFAQWVAAGEPSPAEYDPSADGRDEALSSGNSGDSELYGVLTVYYNMAQKAKAALQGEE